MPKAGWKKNPETGKYDPPAEKLEATPRFDPDDAPIDGDYQMDQVINKDPSKTYALVCAEDMPRMKGRGYVPTERTEGGARPVFGEIGGDGHHVVNGQLTLMEIPKARAERIQREAESRGSLRWNSEQQSETFEQSDRSVSRRTERLEQSVMTR